MTDQFHSKVAAALEKDRAEIAQTVQEMKRERRATGPRPSTPCWRDLYPEGSTVFIGRDRYTVAHNEQALGLDLFDKDDQLVMTIAPEYVPVIASGIKYPEVSA